MPPVVLRGATGLAVAPEDFLDLLAPAVAAWEERLADEGFAPLRAAWLARATRLGEEITARLPDRAITGRFETIDADRRAGARHRRRAAWCCRRRRSTSPGGAGCCSPLTSATPTRSSRCTTAQRVVGEWRCRTERQRTADEYFVWLRQLMDLDGIDGRDQLGGRLRRWCRRCVFNLRVLAGPLLPHPRRWWSASPTCELPVAAAGRSRHAGRRRPAGQHRRRLRPLRRRPDRRRLRHRHHLRRGRRRRRLCRRRHRARASTCR